MNKTLKIIQIALDRINFLWYNTIMKNTTKKTYTITHLRKLSPNSKAYKKAIARSKGMLTGNPDIYQATGKMMLKKDQKKIIYS